MTQGRGTQLALFCLALASGCSESTVTSSQIGTYFPLDALVSASSDASVMEPFVLTRRGAGLSSEPIVWGAGNQGIWSYDSVGGQLTYQRSIGSNVFTDMNYWPAEPRIRQRFRDWLSVQADMTVRLYDGTSDSACGFTFGFGEDGVAHATNSSVPLNLRLGGRDWSALGTPTAGGMDFIRVVYQANSGASGGDRLRIDVPINAFNQGTGANYDFSSLASFKGAAFNVQAGADQANAAEEWLKVRLRLDHDFEARTIRVTVTPVTSSETMTGWVSQTVTWNYDNAPGTTVSGQARSGFDMTGIPGVSSFEELGDQPTTLGFTAIGGARICSFIGLQTQKRLRTD